MAESRVAASYVLLLYEYLERQGLDPARVLDARPEPEQHFVPMPQWQDWLRRVDVLEKRRPGLGLRIAECVSARHFGVVGYAALACGHLLEALQRLERYHASVYDANLATVSMDPNGVSAEVIANATGWRYRVLGGAFAGFHRKHLPVSLEKTPEGNIYKLEAF